jgi:PKD repeat protein
MGAGSSVLHTDVLHGFSRVGLVSGWLALALMLGATPAAGAPTPDFDVSSPVVAGAPATFTSKSVPTGNLEITATDWSFGDGTGGSGTVIQHIFPSPGTYLVTLTATDMSGSASVSRQVTVLSPPVASFIFTPDPPVAGRPTTFASTATPVPGQSIASLEWDFNQDGVFDASGGTATHVFPSGGEHVVRLHVGDSSGVSAELIRRIRVNAPPAVSFTVAPGEPLVGQQVSLTSTSKDAEGPLTEHAWDLDADGNFDDASGSTVSGMFMSAGRHSIALRVTDSDGTSSTLTRAITVRAPDPPRTAGSEGRPPGAAPGPFLTLMAPFPIVRLAGEVVRNGARIRTLSVRAPSGARVMIRCRGSACPAARVQRRVVRRPVRFRALERFLPAGSVLEVLVRRGDQIGKYTHFRIRRGRVPRRTDGCLPPNSTRGVRCPGT